MRTWERPVCVGQIVWDKNTTTPPQSTATEPVGVLCSAARRTRGDQVVLRVTTRAMGHARANCKLPQNSLLEYHVPWERYLAVHDPVVALRSKKSAVLCCAVLPLAWRCAAPRMALGGAERSAQLSP